MKRSLILVLLVMVVLTGLCACKAPDYQIEEFNNNNIPTIDFMQPWAFYNKSVEELTSHFAILANEGFNTVIIQSTASYEKGEPQACYYNSQTQFPQYHPDFLQNVLQAAKTNGIKVVAGTCSDDYWWKCARHSYNNATLQMLYKQETENIKELLQYDIDGLYYTNEMFSNPFGYEGQWIKHLNSIIQFIEEQSPQMPVWISPFNSSAFLQSCNSKVKMWDRFFKEVNFRKGDLFLLQDGFGNLPSSPTQKQCQEVYDLDLQIRNCCLANSKADFALNIEYFSKDGYATQQRIMLQTEYANKLGNAIACFSYSHYFI